MSLLRDSLKNLGRDYTAIQKLLPDRTIAAVRDRGCIMIKEEKLEVKKTRKRSPWTQAETSLLRDSLKNLGRDFHAIQKVLPHKTIASVRNRGYIMIKEEKLDVGKKQKHSPWTQAEMSLMRDSLKKLGRDYTAIQKLLPDRTIAAVRVRGCIIMKEEKLEVKKKAKVGLHVCGINGCTYTTKHTTHLKSHKIACMKRAIILQQGGNKKQRKGPTPTGKVWDKQKGIWL